MLYVLVSGFVLLYCLYCFVFLSGGLISTNPWAPVGQSTGPHRVDNK